MVRDVPKFIVREWLFVIYLISSLRTFGKKLESLYMQPDTSGSKYPNVHMIIVSPPRNQRKPLSASSRPFNDTE